MPPAMPLPVGIMNMPESVFIKLCVKMCYVVNYLKVFLYLCKQE